MKNDAALLVSDKKGKISVHPALVAVGMKAGHLFKLNGSDLIKLPAGSRLFMLPDRAPVGYDAEAVDFTQVFGFFAVAAFVRPGFTATYSPAYSEYPNPEPLPLFSYAACALYRGELYTTAVLVDKDRRHDQRFIDIAHVRKNSGKFKKLFPGNKLIAHLKGCALTYGCPNAQNFFLSRYEAPLPVSPSCNARCLGCISFQPGKRLCASQPKIKFVPTPDEISEIALFHIKSVKDPIVSFGQGCEGEPLLSGAIIDKAIKIIRRKTDKGIININTNGSAPKVLAKLFDSGLDSVRVSMNSARAVYYSRYYKPNGYSFGNVMASIRLAKKKKNRFVSLNYLTMPGFTDSQEEFAALKALVRDIRPDMIQWRNLNYDPLFYFRELKVWPQRSKLIGIKGIMDRLRKEYPSFRMGYFNPGKTILREAASRHR